MKTYLKEKLIRSLERREFIAYLSKLSLGTVAILKGGLVTSSELQKSKNIRQELDFILPGTIGNASGPSAIHTLEGSLLRGSHG